jgi:hypothetical protein
MAKKENKKTKGKVPKKLCEVEDPIEYTEEAPEGLKEAKLMTTRHEL